MLIDLVEQYVVKSLGGKRHPRLPFWNAADDNQRLDHATFSFIADDGEVIVNAYEKKPNTEWPKHRCVGDSYRNKFAATMYRKGNFVVIVDFININKNNLDKFLGQFRGQ